MFRRLLARGICAARPAPIKKREFPPRYKVDEREIEEKFIKGGGKGGQKINKTNSKVQLRHIPTGIVVNSQFSRSREDNRKRAREVLGERLDDLINGENSRSAVIRRYYQQKAQKKRQRHNQVVRRSLDAAGAENATEIAENVIKDVIERAQGPAEAATIAEAAAAAASHAADEAARARRDEA